MKLIIKFNNNDRKKTANDEIKDINKFEPKYFFFPSFKIKILFSPVSTS
jgi:hypothetical protein